MCQPKPGPRCAADSWNYMESAKTLLRQTAVARRGPIPSVGPLSEAEVLHAQYGQYATYMEASSTTILGAAPDAARGLALADAVRADLQEVKKVTVPAQIAASADRLMGSARKTLELANDINSVSLLAFPIGGAVMTYGAAKASAAGAMLLATGGHQGRREAARTALRQRAALLTHTSRTVAHLDHLMQSPHGREQVSPELVEKARAAYVQDRAAYDQALATARFYDVAEYVARDGALDEYGKPIRWLAD